MSKTAVLSRSVRTSSSKPRLQIQKPESTISNPSKLKAADPLFGFFYKFLLVSSYILSALALCLAIAA